jgi:hypothetical protein
MIKNCLLSFCSFVSEVVDGFMGVDVPSCWIGASDSISSGLDESFASLCSINPGSGLPMIDGEHGGIDVAGNSYGLDDGCMFD